MLSTRQQIEKNEIIKILSELKPTDLSVRDAKRFSKQIATGKEKEILARSNRVMHSAVQPIGLAGAALLNDKYTRKGIAITAQKVRETKAGECQSIAQLAADHLLKKMESKELAPRLLQIFTFENGCTSAHTFVGLGYTDGIKNASEPCLLIDLWAAALGHDKTQGVFTFDDYPFPYMLSPLRDVYDNKEMLKPAPTIIKTITSGTHPIYQPPIENKEVTNQFIQALLKKYPTMLTQIQTSFDNPHVQTGIKTLIKRFKDPSIVSQKILGLFEHGMGNPLSPLKYSELTENERPAVISAAKALHDAYLVGKATTKLQLSR